MPCSFDHSTIDWNFLRDLISVILYQFDVAKIDQMIAVNYQTTLYDAPVNKMPIFSQKPWSNIFFDSFEINHVIANLYSATA